MGREPVAPGLRPCLSCGHHADDHLPLRFGSYRTHDGLLVEDVRLGPCLYARGEAVCPCMSWDPDSLSRVSRLLGLDVRRVIL